jgi:hypothetical protein
VAAGQYWGHVERICRASIRHSARVFASKRAPDLAAVLVILSLLGWKLGQVLQSTLPSPLHGEWWGVHSFSDYLTLLGARHFAEEGFLANFFTANISVGFPEFARGWHYYQVPLLVQNSGIYYTHYGSVDTYISGLLMSAGFENITQFYVVFTVASFFSLALWYVTSSLLFGRTAGLISTAVFGTAVNFLSVAETNCAESLAIQFTMLAIFCFVLAQRVLKSRSLKIAAYSITWVACFLQANNNPQFLIFIALFIGGYLWLYAPRNRSSIALFSSLFSGLLAGLIVHLALNAWVLGGFGNMLTDLVSALMRRTSDFAIAIETGYRDFQLSQVPAYLETMMWNFWHLELFGIVALAVLTLWMLGRSGTKEEVKALRKQWGMAAVMLAGGLGFILIFIQATVTQPMDILKVMLPGIGSLIGLAVVASVRYFRKSADPLNLKAAFGIILAVILLPFCQFIATGVPFSNTFMQRDEYQGGTPEQVRAAASFIGQNTKYGDIVLTNINTGETGHNLYPHPSWEYLSGRRVEVFNSLDQADRSLRLFLNKRDSLPAGNPAKQVEFFVLINHWQDISALGDLCRGSGNIVAKYDSREDWISRAGFDPYPDDSRIYDLYKVDPARWLTVSDSVRISRSVQPDPRTPWTRTVTGLDSRDRDSVALWWLPRFSFLRDSGTVLFASSPSAPVASSLEVPLFSSEIGSTTEARLRIIKSPMTNRDSAVFSLIDGRHEMKMSFSGGMVSVFDRERLITTFELPGGGGFHTYRLAIAGDIGRAYLDGEFIASARLVERASVSYVLFGDLMPFKGDPFIAELDYITYAVTGAYGPDGGRLQPELSSEDLKPWGIDPRSPLAARTDQPQANVPWTKVFKISTGVASRSLPEWKLGQPTHAFLVSGGKLALASFGIGGNNLSYTDDSLSNLRGTTFEIGMWMPKAPQTGLDTAIVSVQDGRREVKLSFHERYIDVLDQNTRLETILLSPGDAYHIYRVALTGNRARIYLDGVLAAQVTLTRDIASKTFLIGDFSTGEGGFSSVIDYIAYTTQGAYDPAGTRLTQAPGN